MDPFLGIITLFAGNFAPRGWAFCNGQLLPISGNEALFSLLGTFYGGDGQTTFALPDFRGRVIIHAGRGPGLSNYQLGDKGGVESVTLLQNQLPQHTHALTAVNSQGTSADPANRLIAKDLLEVALNNSIEADSFGNASPMAMAASSISPAGGGQAHSNLMPSLGLNYIIALEGIYPPRS